MKKLYFAFAFSLLSLSAQAQFSGGGVSGSGTVSSVALTAPSIFTLSGSPVTNAGTFALGLASQTANTFFAGPNGAAGAPAFRPIATADLPVFTSAQITGGLGFTPLNKAGDIINGLLTINGGFRMNAGITFYYDDPSAPTDEKFFDAYASGGLLVYRAVNDSYTNANAYMEIARTGFVPIVYFPSAVNLQGTSTAPTVSSSDNSTNIATTSFVKSITPVLSAGKGITITGTVPAQTISSTSTPPTRTILTPGSGTYTTPAGATYLTVEAWAGGGSGGGASASGGTSPKNGLSGGATTFGSLISLGGGGGGVSTPLPVAGAGGAVTAGTNGIAGQLGGVYNQYSEIANGGAAYKSAGGLGIEYTKTTTPAATMPGAGGGGITYYGYVYGAGGGGGAYDSEIISAPAASYAYSVGAGGAAVFGGQTTSGAGAPGKIIVIAHY